ncbi:MFS family permease [Paenibacillus shirakamiensis]|uniref:MFS family permease n=1 Tax=Paenibacillus shirakamiensis TaxID=1265935 RepID=A0ABS4JL10_9BACL|nr:MFS transporter [Paenibacillus shirakamiensis]MBP2002410.1 MFS family permease [Paenibacillus shirakamiensis]
MRNLIPSVPKPRLPTRQSLLLLSGVGISGIGDFIYLIAINILVLQMTSSPAAVAGLWMIAPLASICTKFWAGSVVDRHDQRRLMMFMDILRAIFVATLPLLPNIWIMYACIFIISMGSALFAPASQVHMTRIIPAESRKRYNSSQAFVTSGAFVLGPAIAGVVLLYGSPSIAIYLDAVSFLMSAFLISRLPRLHSQRDPQELRIKLSLRIIASDWITVIQFSRRATFIMTIYVLFQIIFIIGVSLDAQEVVMIRQVIGLSSAEYAALISLTGIGYLGGSLVNSLIIKWSSVRYLIGCGVMMVSTGYLLFALSHSFFMAAASFVLLGFSSAFSSTGFMTFYQNHISVDYMGRISSVFGLMISVMHVVTILVVGLAAEQFTLRTVYISVSALLVLLSIWLLFLTLRPSRRVHFSDQAQPSLTL